MEGKRVVEGGGSRLAWVIPVVILAVLAAAYFGLCALAGRDVLWPHTTLGGVDVSDLHYADAAQLLETELPRLWSEHELTVIEPDSGRKYTLPLNGAGETTDLGQDVLNASRGGSKDTPFPLLGARFLMNLFGGQTAAQPELELSPAGEKAVTDLLHQMDRDLGETGGESSWKVEENILTVTKGVTALRADREAMEAGLLAGLKDPTTAAEVSVPLVDQPPEAPDWQAIYDELYVEPVDAQLDRETWEIVPSVTGVSFDMEAAANLFDHAAEGSQVSLELTLTEPEITTQLLDENLFKDTLGAAATKFTGTSARRANIARACALMNGRVLFPGEEFSYSKTCSPYSFDNGYGLAGAYVDGKTVDSLAGGICQGSSTLYWAVLKSNLKVVERYPHIYEPAYIAGGLDATVYGSYGTPGYLDFRFQNNTQAPIRITAYVDKDNFVRISIQGTNTSGVTGQPYSANRTVTQYATTIYEPNPNVPQGTTQRDRERTAYNAVSIDTYQQLVNAEGKIISTEFVHRDNYRLRNAVVFYNPADAALWGIDPATGLQTLTPVPPTPTPGIDPNQPIITPLPQLPEVTPGGEDVVTPPPPAVTTAPEATPAPAETAAPEVTPAPAETAAPVTTPAPAVTVPPAPSAAPEVPSEVPSEAPAESPAA